MESKIQCFQLKLLKLFTIYTNYKYFSYKYFTFCVNIRLLLQTNIRTNVIFILGKLSLCCRYMHIPWCMNDYPVLISLQQYIIVASRSANSVTGYFMLDWPYLFLISNFCHVLNVVCFLLGDYPASEFYMPTFRNTLFHLHRQVGACRMN